MPSRCGEGRSGRGRVLTFSVLLALSTAVASAQGGSSPRDLCASGQLCTSSGADVDSLAPLVQKTLEPYLASKSIPGAVVGISWRGRRTYFGYGFSDRDGTRPFDPATIVEIGSITKVFTTALFEEAVAENRVQLDSKLRSYAAVLGVAPMDGCGGQKSLQQLADFTSGMPRMPNVPQPAPNIQAYTADDFLRWLSGWASAGANDGDARACEADAAYEYSNASVGVLGVILEAVYRQSWSELVSHRISGPLGMDSTFVDVPPGQAHRVAQGYGPRGYPSRPWPVFAWFAAGALRSDAADMLSFGEAALGDGAVNGATARAPAIAALEAAIASAMVPVYDQTLNGHTFGQGLAWEELIPNASQFPIYVKNGGTSGFSTVLAVNKKKDLAVFVAFPKEGTDAEAIGVRLVRQVGSGE